MKPPPATSSFWSLGELLRTANCTEVELRETCDKLNIESAQMLIGGVEFFDTPHASLILSTIQETRKAPAPTADPQDVMENLRRPALEN